MNEIPVEVADHDNAYQRGLLLYQHEHYSKALEQFIEHLKEYADDPWSMGYVALCWMRLGKRQKATKAAEQAIRFDPECVFAHIVLAQTLRAQGKSAKALEAIQRALALAPERADILGHVATLYCDLKRWSDALDYSEKGLSQDPADENSLQARAWALINLGRIDEGTAILEELLREHPEDVAAMTSLGYAALRQGRREQALEYFSCALQNRPEDEEARAGFLEALRSRYPLYGLVVRYLLWFSTLPDRVRMGIMVVEHFAEKYLREVARRNPALRPLITGFLYLWSAFSYLALAGRPLCNSLLRLNRHARKFLRADEIVESNLVTASVLMGLSTWGYWHYSHRIWSLVACIIYFTLVIPVTNAYSCDRGWPRKIMQGFAVALFVLGNLAIWGFHENPLTGGAGRDCIQLYGLLLMANQLVAMQMDKIKVDD